MGMEQEIGLAVVGEDDCTYTRIATLPDGLGPSIMVNDGCVAPNGDVVIGTKDFNFDVEARLAGTWRYRADTKTVEPLFTREVCANGNCFLDIDGATHLVHVDTGPKALYAMPFDMATHAVGEPRLLFDFSCRESFDA